MSNGDDLTGTPGGSESIYAAPASETAVAPEGDLMAAYLGPKNANYYLDRFQRFEGGGGSASWNWPAFLISTIWLLYRKMWLYGFLYWIVLPVALIFVSGMVSAAAGAETGVIFYYGSYILYAFVLLPVFANRMYYGHAKKKIDGIAATASDPTQQALEAARKGGTSTIALVIVPFFMVFVIGILAAIAIPAYQDYTVRAQVSEGMNLAAGARAAVAEYYTDMGELPADNSTAGVSAASSINGNYVRSVEVRTGSIVVTYGNLAHAIIDGKTLELRPQMQDSAILDWDCSSPTIPAKHLPAMCR